MATTLSRALPDPKAEPTISVARAAAVLGFGLRTAYRAAESGEWPVVRVGRATKVLTKKFLAQYDLDDA